MFLKNLKNLFSCIKKSPVNYFISIIGLVMGICIFLLLFAFFRYYQQYDRYFDDYNNWYRLRLTITNTNSVPVQKSEFITCLLPQILKQNKEIEDILMMKNYSLLVRFYVGENIIPLGDNFFVTPNLIKHYKLKFIYGDPDSALSQDKSLIVSRSYAKKYFGKENILGTQIYIKNFVRYIVTGVFEDLPENLHYRHDSFTTPIDFYTPYEDYKEKKEIIYNEKAYVLLKITKPNSINNIKKNINYFLKQYDNDSFKLSAEIESMKKLHFIQGLQYDAKTMNFKSIIMVLIVAILILITSFLNFLNLLVLSWKNRQDEFIFRKTLGATKLDLLKQIFTEFSLIYLFSIILALIAYFFLFDIFKAWTSLKLDNYYLLKDNFTMMLTGILVIVGLLIALIPSNKIARFNSIQEYNRKKQKKMSLAIILFTQIFICTVFLISLITLNVRMNEIISFDKGYNSKNLFQYQYLTSSGSDSYKTPQYLKQIILEQPGVKKFSFGNIDFAQKSKPLFEMLTIKSIYKKQEITGQTHILGCDPNFFKTLGIKIIKGDIKDIHNNEVVVNKTFSEYFYPNQNPIGKVIKSANTSDQYGTFNPVIKAVVEDFYPGSLHEKLFPTIYFCNNEWGEFFYVYLQEGKRDIALKNINKTMDNLTKDGFFYYDTTDIESRDKEFYKDDMLFVKLILIFALISFFIALFGVYSISAFHIGQELKNISIHKINGAELKDIIKAYLPYYGYISLIAGIGGCGVAFYITGLFNDRFMIKGNSEWYLFLVGAFFTMLCVLIPFIFNVYKAYHTKPAKYLNKE